MLEAWLHALGAAAPLIADVFSPRTETLVLPPTEPGLDSEASLWVHNRTSSLVASVELHATILVSPEEFTVPAEAHAFLPEPVVLVEPGTCREMRVRVSVPPEQPPGQYHGLLVGSGAPDGAIALLLVVEAPSGGSS